MKKPKLTPYGDYATWVTFEVMANFQVRVIFTNDLLKSATRLGSMPEGTADAFCFNVKGEGRSYIFLKMDSPENVVAHECWHIIHRMFTWCNVSEWDNEVSAYHLDHLVEEVYKFKKAILQEQEKPK